nr:MAG TPA: hypothetical protein [Caudoviricetes sp.]
MTSPLGFGLGVFFLFAFNYCKNAMVDLASICGFEPKNVFSYRKNRLNT